MYWEIPPADTRAESDEKLLDQAERGVEQEPTVRRVVRKTPITVSNFRGVEIEYIATDGGTYVARLIVADSRLYGVVGGGRFVQPGNDNIRRFLDSFTIIDLNLRPNAPPPVFRGRQK